MTACKHCGEDLDNEQPHLPESCREVLETDLAATRTELEALKDTARMIAQAADRMREHEKKTDAIVRSAILVTHAFASSAQSSAELESRILALQSDLDKLYPRSDVEPR